MISETLVPEGNGGRNCLFNGLVNAWIFERMEVDVAGKRRPAIITERDIGGEPLELFGPKLCIHAVRISALFLGLNEGAWNHGSGANLLDTVHGADRLLLYKMSPSYKAIVSVPSFENGSGLFEGAVNYRIQTDAWMGGQGFGPCRHFEDAN